MWMYKNPAVTGSTGKSMHCDGERGEVFNINGTMFVLI